MLVTTALQVVDSVMNNFRTDYVGRGELAERQQRLNQYLMQLKKMAEEFNLAVLLVNQVTANPDGSMVRRRVGSRRLRSHRRRESSTDMCLFFRFACSLRGPTPRNPLEGTSWRMRPQRG